MGSGREAIGILERVLAGDSQAVADIVGAGWPRAGTGLTRGPGAIELEELRQEAAREVIEVARGFDPARDGDFAAVATARARRRILQVLRNERRRRSRLAPLDVIGAREPCIEMTTRSGGEIQSRRLASALRQLSPRLRSIIVRVYWDDRPLAEIAAAENLSVDAVRHARLRAEAILRRAIVRAGPISRRR